MDVITETPAKKRKTEVGYISSSQGYDSREDSGDDLFRDYETIATLPLPKHAGSSIPSSHLRSSPAPYITQPTQILSNPTQDTVQLASTQSPSTVQVAASSPVRAPNAMISKTSGGILASAIAPAGTAFRLPISASRPPPKPTAIVDLSDDDDIPVYRGNYSDEESQLSRRADIKPSTFIQRAQKAMAEGTAKPKSQAGTEDPVDRFREITSNSFYKPLAKHDTKGQGSALSGSVFDSRNRDERTTSSRIEAPKRSADVMANAYGGSNKPVKVARQTAPAKAQLKKPLTLDDIPDYNMRTKIARMRTVCPMYSIMQCRNALFTKKFNYDDAMDYLLSTNPDPVEIDLTIDDDTVPPVEKPNPARAPAKQQVKVPNKSIQERWTATQAAARNIQSVTSSSPVELPKAKRRLVQGRRNPSSPVIEQHKSSSPPPPLHQTPESETDSGIGHESEEDTELEGKVLKFFNTCSVPDLVDIASITAEIASVILSQKPFKSLQAVRQISSDIPAKGKKTTRRPIGEKIVEKCLEMWTGYEAIDELVKKCEALGKPIAEAMKKWGADSKDGELELVTLDQLNIDQKSDSQASMRDSGIGTPASGSLSGDESGGEIKKQLRGKQSFFSQPSIMAEGVVLKDYQVVGVNWLSLLFGKNLSCILADDMGLGKTCQVIAFLAHLLEKGIKGPHLIVVPGSTLENWLREFSVFCPKLSVMPYYAEQKERLAVREQIEENLDDINVIVTTYGMAKRKEDNRWLRKLQLVACVYDEGHMLRNSKSAQYEQLMRIPARFRLLLTGTPLQNNLHELASLLGFILPSVFKEHSEDLTYIFNHRATTTTDETHAALLSAQRIARARSMMTPFILRRKKHQVLKHLPTKTRRVEYCDLTACQRELYAAEQSKARQIMLDRLAGKKNSTESANIMMALRKASIHPLLFRRLYTPSLLSKMSKACLSEPEFAESNVNYVYEDMEVMTDYELHLFCERYSNTMSSYALKGDECMESGKVALLTSLLTQYKTAGDRVLVFSQFVMVMNILEAVLERLSIPFFRLDGSTKIDERQDMIDAFYADPSITVFLLSTKAGGAGINLACANKVIIFDSSFNPQDDIQAENRAHRVGQTRDVEVVRLVTKGTIEEQILALGETKLALDDRVAGEGEEDGAKAEREGVKRVEEMMIKEIKGEGVLKK